MVSQCRKANVASPESLRLEDILKPHASEQRIYRLRCVEGWSMVIPWVGFPLADFIKRFQPNSRAKFVEFQTLNDKEQMPGVRRRYSTGRTQKVCEWMKPCTL